MVVTLSRDQIRESPSVDTDKPVSEQNSEQNAVLFRECYLLPYYWAIGGFLWEPTPSSEGQPTAPTFVATPWRKIRKQDGDPHLRSTGFLRGYGVRAIDGDIGHVEDFLIDDGSWALRCVVVSTRHWRSAKRVLVPSDWIAWVSWIELTVHVDLLLRELLNAPEFDLSHPFTDQDEAQLRAAYGGRPPRSRYDARTT